MACLLTQDEIQDTIRFHGHSCPGLAIGLRAAELARRRWPNASDAELVSVVETDMCGVDAIQFILGCTFGKGNLIHKDYGKMAFRFYYRPTGEGFRVLLNPEIRADLDEEIGALNTKITAGTADESDKERSALLQREMNERFMEVDLEEMFFVSELEPAPPRAAAILKSMVCETCGEKTMESRTRRFAGRTLCIPCFQNVEQKI